MNDKYTDPAALEDMLRDLQAEDLELLEPPDQIWDRIEAATGTRGDDLSRVVPIRSRRPATRRVLIGVVAALMAVVIGVGALIARRDVTGQVLATATLAYDPASFDALGAGAVGGAHLVSHDGTLKIEIVDADLPSPGEGADLEVWLIRPDESGNVADLVSLGVVSPSDPESLDVPPSHDPSLYNVVDISVEPRDGDASHSGRTVLRGPLTEV